MNETLLLDTAFIVALHLSREQHHGEALKYWKAHRASNAYVTTSFVLDEVATYLSSRGFHARAVEIGEDLMASRSARLTSVEDLLFMEAWGYFVAHRDKSYSLTDCVSFVLMGRLDIRTALTFDRHFAQAGFRMLP